ncbi:DUF2971 domain-containing protein [Streptococcus chosunense]|uniref:DUF2971 domain-containing protein n=1 Tax=Streptococcus chosunensis TaxID=2707003 RepID=A0A3B0BMK9_9STRE|nr:DUF2971 domain-containing protein [Streptococcus chosunense]RKN73448.1 DUF2971 domain-containing protein [Streptococcus chosunense]
MVEYKYFNRVYNEVTNKNFSDSFIFFKDDWNDYGYYITFRVYYYDEDCGERYIGSYRIYEAEIEEQKDINGIKSIFKLTEADFDMNQKYSLACNLEFYRNLYELCSENYDEFLAIHNDLILNDLPEGIKENEGVKFALLRNDGVTNSEDIIKFNEALKKLDSNLNVGNYLSSDKITEYFLTLLEEERVEDLKKEIEDLVEKSNFNYNLLKKLIEHCIENSSKDTHQVYYNTLLSLVKKKNYEQLKSELETIDKDELKEISDNVNIIKDKLKYRVEGEDFIHYTSLNTLKFLLYKIDDKDNYPRLRLSNARQMNDPNEGYTFLNLIGIKKEELSQTDYDTSPFFFASMTQTGNGQNLDDSLPMWKQYGDDAKGINLTYHSEYIKSLIEDGIEIYKVCYNVKEDLLEEEINSIKSAFNEIKNYDDDKEKEGIFLSALNLIDDIRYLFKDADYSYENEYRIIQSYEGNEDVIFSSESSNSVIPGLYAYIDKELKYSKIKLGPKCDDIDFVAPYIKFVDRNIEVTKSQISYR